MARSNRKVNLAGREIGCSCHACAFFHNDDQFYKVMLPFIREGFAAGDRAVHIVDPAKRDRHIDTLSAAGIDARGDDRRQLEVTIDGRKPTCVRATSIRMRCSR